MKIKLTSLTRVITADPTSLKHTRQFWQVLHIDHDSAETILTISDGRYSIQARLGYYWHEYFLWNVMFSGADVILKNCVIFVRRITLRKSPYREIFKWIRLDDGHGLRCYDDVIGSPVPFPLHYPEGPVSRARLFAVELAEAHCIKVIRQLDLNATDLYMAQLTTDMRIGIHKAGLLPKHAPSSTYRYMPLLIIAMEALINILPYRTSRQSNLLTELVFVIHYLAGSIIEDILQRRRGSSEAKKTTENIIHHSRRLIQVLYELESEQRSLRIKRLIERLLKVLRIPHYS